MRESIFLVGPMGAGKSTSGRLLARTLGMRFIDSDKIIEQRQPPGGHLAVHMPGVAGIDQ